LIEKKTKHTKLFRLLVHEYILYCNVMEVQPVGISRYENNKADTIVGYCAS